MFVSFYFIFSRYVVPTLLCTEYVLEFAKNLVIGDLQEVVDILISYSWVRGHAYHLYRKLTRLERMNIEALHRPLTRNERMNIESDTIAYQIRMEACGPRGPRPQCSHWELERVSLSIEGFKCTGHMKQKLRLQLHNRDVRDYIRLKEE
jgi:hypothetical protein